MTVKKKLIPYLLWAFGIAWVLQLTACWFFNEGKQTVFQLLLAVSIFAPLAAAALSRSGIKSLGWKLRLKKKWKYFLSAWFLPAILGTLGAALYFLLFPSAFDPVALIGEEGLAKIEAQGFSLSHYVIIATVFAVIFAPFFNAIAAVGEEAGWRGVMYPALKERFGATKGRILGGILWGAWHWPVIIFSGYEYGADYWGAPITGMVIFCVFTTTAGILLDWLYEKTACIWIPALAHGAINAFSVPIVFLNPVYNNRLLLGPMMHGLIGGLPFLLIAVWISIKRTRQSPHKAPMNK